MHGSPPAMFSPASFTCHPPPQRAPPTSSEPHPPPQRAPPTSSEHLTHLLREPHPPPQSTTPTTSSEPHPPPQRATPASPESHTHLLREPSTSSVPASASLCSDLFPPHLLIDLSALYFFTPFITFFSLFLPFIHSLTSNSCWCCSVAKLCPTLCDAMDCSTPRLPVFHRLLEFAQTRIHWVSDAIQPPSFVFPLSCLQSFPASGSFPASRFFASGGQSVGASASILPMNSQGWFPLGWTGLISLLSQGLSRVFSSTTVWEFKFLLNTFFFFQTPLK